MADVISKPLRKMEKPNPALLKLFDIVPPRYSKPQVLDADDLFSELGFQLPDDYLDISRNYGRGEFRGSLWISLHDPTSSKYIPRIKSDIDDFNDMVAEFKLMDEECELTGLGDSPFPERILPIGYTDNCCNLAYLRDGAPADWRVVAFAAYEPDEFVYTSMTVVELLLGSMTNKIGCLNEWHDRELMPDPPYFAPADNDGRFIT